jgi:hypothetical protein
MMHRLSLLSHCCKMLVRNGVSLAAVGIVTFLICLALFGPMLTPCDP